LSVRPLIRYRKKPLRRRISEPRDSADPQTGTVLAADLLTSARDIRVLVRPDPPETLIYSFWQNGDGDAFWQQVQIERNDWPYHTKIVRMPARGEADNIRELLGPDLAAEFLRMLNWITVRSFRY
jgi:hypothetical protein